MIFDPALLTCAAAAGEAVSGLCVEVSEGSEYATTFAVSRQYQPATASIESTVSRRWIRFTKSQASGEANSLVALQNTLRVTAQSRSGNCLSRPCQPEC